MEAEAARRRAELSSVVVYTKNGCHLCERVIAELLRLVSERSFEISIKDITSDPHLFECYKNMVPVVAVDGRVGLVGGSARQSKYARRRPAESPFPPATVVYEVVPASHFRWWMFVFDVDPMVQE